MLEGSPFSQFLGVFHGREDTFSGSSEAQPLKLRAVKDSMASSNHRCHRNPITISINYLVAFHYFRAGLMVFRQNVGDTSITLDTRQPELSH